MSEAERRIPRPHHNFVPEYQQSGIPHVETRTLPASADTAALVGAIDSYKFEFDSVTRWIQIHNHGENAQQQHLRMYFNETAAKTAYELAANQDKHYFLIDEESSTSRLEVKSKVVYLVPDVAAKSFKVSVVAGLTSVKSEDFPDQTRANGFLGIEEAP